MAKQVKTYEVLTLVFGLLSLVAWIIPIIGVPIAITGLVFGFLCLGHEEGSAVIPGFMITLCILSLIACGINGYIGYQQARGIY